MILSGVQVFFYGDVNIQGFIMRQVNSPHPALRQFRFYPVAVAQKGINL
jgi:hypothetical protein